MTVTVIFHCRVHLKQHIYCKVEGCPRKFDRNIDLKRHLEKAHPQFHSSETPLNVSEPSNDKSNRDLRVSETNSNPGLNEAAIGPSTSASTLQTTTPSQPQQQHMNSIMNELEQHIQASQVLNVHFIVKFFLFIFLDLISLKWGNCKVNSFNLIEEKALLSLNFQKMFSFLDDL